MTAPQTALEILAGLAADRPDRVCLYLLRAGQPDTPVTTAQLLRHAAGYARAYQQAGIAPGEVVILILQHGLDLIAAFWGAVLHGAVPSIMPFLTEKLLPERYRRDLAALVEVTRPAAVLTFPEFLAEVQAALQDGPGVVHTVMTTEAVQPAGELVFSLLRGGERSLDEIMFLQHSSGTTGLQKGVAISQRALWNQLQSYSAAIHLSADDVIVSWLPLYHDMGLIAGFLLPILKGVPLVLMSPFEWVKAPARLLQAVTRYRGTLSWLPNFAFNFCAQKIRDSQLEGIDLSTWRAVINCSEPVFLISLEQFAERFAPYGFRRTALATSYAMAENVFGVTQSTPGVLLTIDCVDLLALQQGQARPVDPHNPQQQVAKLVSCGRPIAGTRVRVVNTGGVLLAERQVGELEIHSDCMLTEYYHRPDETRASVVDGWYRSGDLGYIAAGEVYVTGRKKDMLIVGGRNVFPQDLEMLASEVAGVHAGRVVAFGINNPEAGTEEAVLIAEVEQPLSPDPNDPARRALEDAIRMAVNRGSAISLRHIVLVDSHWLIKTSSGKIARSANREKFLAEFGLQK